MEVVNLRDLPKGFPIVSLMARWFWIRATALAFALPLAAHNGRLDQGIQLLPKPYRRRELAKRIRGIFDAPC
jgi:hypothetical protein